MSLFTSAVIFHTDENGNKQPVGQIANVLKVEPDLANKRWGEEHTDAIEVAKVALEATSKDGWSTSKTSHPDYDARLTLEAKLKEVEPTVRATTNGDFIAVSTTVFEVVDGALTEVENGWIDGGFSGITVRGPKVVKTGDSAA